MKKISALALLTLVFSIVGCTYNQAPIIKTPSIAQSPIQTGTATLTPIPTTTLTRTLTVTPPPQITATELLTREITLTRTPQPTLESLEAENIVQQYLRDNRGCKLPCWWGIIPGKTTREEAETFLELIAKINVEKSEQVERIWFHHQILNAPEGAEIYGSLDYKQGKVSHIYIFKNGTAKSFKLPQLLLNYGKPDEIKLQVYRQVFDGYPPFTMLLIYKEQGIIAEFLTETEYDSQYLKGCFKGGFEYEGGPDLWLFDTSDPDLTELNFFFPRTQAGPNAPPVLSIDQAVGIDIEDFYQKYRVPGNNCIYTPETLWPDLEQMEATATAIASQSKTVEPQTVP